MQNDEENVFWWEYRGEDKPLTIYQWIKLIILSTVCLFIFAPLVSKVNRYNKMKQKLKHFEPTITDTWLGRFTSWRPREKPLTDQQIKELVK
jgi:hypothetical protein